MPPNNTESKAQKKISSSQQNADTTGLVAIIVVLAVLLIGSAAAYFLMRRYFARQRARARTVAGVGGEILTMTREKEARGFGVEGSEMEKERGKDIERGGLKKGIF